jgi:hypothetical protein
MEAADVAVLKSFQICLTDLGATAMDVDPPPRPMTLAPWLTRSNNVEEGHPPKASQAPRRRRG